MGGGEAGGQDGGGHPEGQPEVLQVGVPDGGEVGGNSEEEQKSQEEQYERPARRERAPEKGQHSRLGSQESNHKEKLSPRNRKRIQSQAKFKRKEGPLRLEMKIKERWFPTREGGE